MSEEINLNTLSSDLSDLRFTLEKALQIRGEDFLLTNEVFWTYDKDRLAKFITPIPAWIHFLVAGANRSLMTQNIVLFRFEGINDVRIQNIKI